MDLSTTYLGLELPHPLIPGAGPMSDDLATVRRLEDAGAAAIVMRSLFEEQIALEEATTFAVTEAHGHSHGEAGSYFPSPDAFALGPDEYLEQLHRIRRAVGVPVIASLNGVTPGGWLRYASLLEEAGATALELNVYTLATDAAEDARTVEDRTIEMVRQVRSSVRIPVAVKLSPFYTAFANFAHRLDEAGPAGLVLFNRFWQPGIDVEQLEVRRELHLSDSSELPLRLRWLAILSGKVRATLAVTGGVHTVLDVIQSVMAGAHAVQMVSALLHHGPEHLAVLRRALAEWLEEHEYGSLREMQGSMSMRTSPDPEAYERANYMLMLQSWKPGEPKPRILP
jgi:dihydroorotate dehydrogenase (fumarate)